MYRVASLLTYCSTNKSTCFPGAWYTRPGRYDASTGPLYIPSTPPQQTSHSICQDSEGAPVRTVTQVGGTAMILCPQAFDSPLAPIPSASTPDVGTALDAYKSLGATMLHEITHMVLRTRDLAYGSAGARLVAKVGGGHKAQSNADSWAFYALACLMEKRAWTEGFAQPVDDYGKEGPTGKRAVEFDV
ncbi:hypothetical protein BDV95DRAFT_573034 [Massariosphaeria phaeospora]|uniref:Lysine-specific metallo-endopeptidase domain-containing protein n=1 Tax=Massariosphaeria phaeospora TaxID=100035 RepID=A0A7C8I9W6_9PLEO|nr:hypothetical protein BDV95DRAFT_573034 [Massariosphaeria phaeospora]